MMKTIFNGIVISVIAALIIHCSDADDRLLKDALKHYHATHCHQGSKVKVEIISYRVVSENWLDSMKIREMNGQHAHFKQLYSKWLNVPDVVSIRPTGAVPDSLVKVQNPAFTSKVMCAMYKDSADLMVRKEAELQDRINKRKAPKPLTKTCYLLYVRNDNEQYVDTLIAAIDKEMKVWPLPHH